MLVGYVITLRLLWLVRLFGRLPPSVGMVFARLLDAATAAFDLISYASPVGP
ncbi:hypothetical protein [Streptomyces sp. H27-S2]|uniref:hypothetical protein n=1 Tax=Streptomyces antarcticus TaxID=2996458 RepID=UPI002270D4BB|nr:hypothetical protein [Streptomyces sp. H27-S2]MCY0952119.1 hypothetical protein [Streptomyces sp. H27-S2]